MEMFLKDLIMSHFVFLILGTCVTFSVALLYKFFKPTHDKTLVVRLVKDTVHDEIDELKAMVANLATVMDIRLDTLEEKQKIKQIMVDEVGVGRRYIKDTDFLKFYNYYMSSIIDLAMRFCEGNLSDVKQYEMLHSRCEVSFKQIAETIQSIMGTDFAEAFTKLSVTTTALWLTEIKAVYTDARNNKISRVKTVNIKFIQDTIQDMFTLGDSMNLLGDIPKK